MRKNIYKLNLLEKAEIAKEIIIQNYNVADICKFFNVSRTVGKGLFENRYFLCGLDKTDPSLIERYNLSSTETKYVEIDTFLREKILILRTKSVPVNSQIIKKIACDFYKNKNDCESKVTDHFIRNFIKREKLSYIKLHGESASADLSQLEDFKQKFYFISARYNPKDVFNIDETGLYIKESSDKSYVYDKVNDCKNVKKK
ncbi:Jerky protein [Dictyocoela muelleri]|nr:Jerky protein [Dictyocoela muelleri]